MSMDYIRKHYQVPAKRGGRVRFHGFVTGTIVSARGAYLKVRCDEIAQRHLTLHPTWKVEYL